MTATLVSSTGRPLKAETPLAMVAPMVCAGASAPMPAAVESPRTSSSIGGAGAGAVATGVVVGGALERLADDPAGHRRLDLEHAVAGQRRARRARHPDRHRRRPRSRRSCARVVPGPWTDPSARVQQRPPAGAAPPR